MTVVLYASDEGQTTNSTNAWVDKVAASGPVTGGRYIIWVSAEYAGSSVSRQCGVRVLVDGVERAAEIVMPNVANLPRIFNSMGLMELSEGEHSIQLQYRAETTPQTVTMRRARVLVMKH